MSCPTESLEQEARSFTELPGTLLDDALAIIHFPGPEAIEDDPGVIDRHLEAWASRKLPFCSQNAESLDSLARFCERITFYIEDFVSKATSPFSPRAYLNIPSPQAPARDRETNAVKMEDLSPDESERLMTAFIEYELICKIHHHPLSESPWDWKVLERFPGRKVSRWREETLYCVFKYICSLYGALFARSANAWVPLDHSQLIFPDNVVFSSSIYAEDLGLGRLIGAAMAHILAAYGFDLITNFLTACGSTTSDPRYGHSVFQKLTDLARMTRNHQVVLRPWFHPLAMTCNTSWPDSPKLCQRLLKLIPVTLDEETRIALNFGCSGFREDGHRNEQLRRQIGIYRQRGWVFFDDARLFPDNGQPVPAFPTPDDLVLVDKLTAQRFLNVNTACEQHRSRFWQETKMPPYMDPARAALVDDETCPELELPEELQFRALYDALKPRLEPFWK